VQQVLDASVLVVHIAGESGEAALARELLQAPIQKSPDAAVLKAVLDDKPQLSGVLRIFDDKFANAADICSIDGDKYDVAPLIAMQQAYDFLLQSRPDQTAAGAQVARLHRAGGQPREEGLQSCSIAGVRNPQRHTRAVRCQCHPSTVGASNAVDHARVATQLAISGK
jgi:hypothetical protein